MTSQKTVKGDAKGKILEAALDLFSMNGFHATTTRKIADKAGVNEITLFRHFKNKMTLFHEVVNKIQKIGFDPARLKDLKIDGPEDLIRLAVEFAFEMFESHPREVRLLHLAVFLNVDGFETSFIQQKEDEATEFLADAFRQLQDQKKISSKEDPKLLAHMLIMQTAQIAVQRVVRKTSPSSKYDRSVLTEAIINLFMV